ncbi:MAG: hypothetical protein HY231_15470 [Acidobacteria bacterium]|nr:hypothetical protein [Acidobacteriota bacterium]
MAVVMIEHSALTDKREGLAVAQANDFAARLAANTARDWAMPMAANTTRDFAAAQLQAVMNDSSALVAANSATSAPANLVN